MLEFSDLIRTGPDTPGGRCMRLYWQPVYVAKNLHPGWAKPVKILGEDLTLYRGESGTPYLIAGKCAHRGMQLSAGWVEGDCLRCRYHGFKYDGTGQCVEIPMEDDAAATSVRIRSYPTVEYLGFIFAYMGKGEPPPLPRYSEFEAEGAVLWDEVYMRPCNFFNNMDNDPLHIPFAHRESEIFRNRPPEIPVEVLAEESDWGIVIRDTYTSGRLHILHLGFPNILFVRTSEGERDHLAWRVPIDDERHWSFQVDLMHFTNEEQRHVMEERHAARSGRKGRSYIDLGEAVLRGDLRIQDIDGDDKANLIWIQDYVTQVGQGSFADRKSERLTRGDVGVVLFRKIWEREVLAYAETGRVKPWTRSQRVISSYDNIVDRG